MHPLVGKVGTSAVALAAGAGLLLGTASSAVADGAPQISVSIQSPATLVAHGAGISVPMIVNCSADGQQAYLFVSVNEAVGKRIAWGAVDTSVNCTGMPEAVVVTMFSRSAAFSKGHTALVQTTGEVCNASGCASASDSAEIEIN